MGNAQRRRVEERLYPVVVIGFLVTLVAVGLLGVPTPLVIAAGATVAALGIFACRSYLNASGPRARSTPGSAPRPAARQYVPSVLEVAPARRQRGVARRRRRHLAHPLRSR